MKHPFAGVIAPEQMQGNPAVEPAVPTPTRRGLFGLMAGALAVGTVGLIGSAGQAEATGFFGEGGIGRRPTTLALGEEGRAPRRMVGRRPTTLALGEEGRGPATRARFEDGRRRRMKK